MLYHRRTVEADTEACDPLPGDVKVALYRIAQEALTNAAKHGRAATATVYLEGDDGHDLFCSVKDDGRGFETNRARDYLRGGRVGLASMRERVELASGTFNLLAPGATNNSSLQVGMNTGIDFLAENLLGTLDSQCSHLLTQYFTGLDGLLLSLNLGGSNDLVALFGCFGLGFFNDSLGAALSICQACGQTLSFSSWKKASS